MIYSMIMHSFSNVDVVGVSIIAGFVQGWVKVRHLVRGFDKKDSL